MRSILLFAGGHFFLVAASLSLGSEPPKQLAREPSLPPAVIAPRLTYSTCASCANCHPNCYDQHKLSMHARSFSNPVFLAQYQQDVLPRVDSATGGRHQARSCTSCHAPVAHKLARAHVVKPDPATAEVSGVTCDFCHTIAGYHDEEPGNGNYLIQPGDTKFGPFQTRTDWHHEYCQLQTQSEFCAICHSVSNQNGLDVKSTYAEWQASRHAKEGIQCQDCHMSANGFLTEGRAVHDSGRAAVMTLGAAPERSTLYTHRFQGARTQTQIEGAIQLAFYQPQGSTEPGQELELTLLVDNSRTGHKMPSGSVELRFMWLDVEAEVGVERIHLKPLPQLSADSYALTGAHQELDRQILGDGVPDGHRIYRTLLADKRGKTTLAFYDAQKVVFDNRLNASEIRPERYTLKLPSDVIASQVIVSACLRYVAYPDSFATRLGLSKAEAVTIADTRIVIPISRKSAPL